MEMSNGGMTLIPDMIMAELPCMSAPEAMCTVVLARMNGRGNEN